MPSFTGYFRNLVPRIAVSMLGERKSDKLRLFAAALLESVPRTLRERNLAVERGLRWIGGFLAHGATICTDGCKYRLTDLESFGIASPSWESWIWSYLRPTRAEVFLDIGAHLGKYTVKVAKMVGESGLVVAVEPHPANYHALLETIALNGLKNVVALNLAAWQSDQRVRLFVSKYGGGHSAKYNRHLGHLDVDGRALDSVLARLGLHRVDWIKVDVEGAEPEVLRGLLETLSRYRPKLVLEVLSVNKEQVDRFMQALGYSGSEISCGHDPIYGRLVYLYYSAARI